MAPIGAAVVFATGDTLPDGALRYESSNPAVVTVGANGVITARGEGQAQVSVLAEGIDVPVSASVPVTVRATVAAITIAPPSATVNLNDSVQFRATARDRRGNALVRTFSWSSTAPSIASIDASSGLSKALSAGNPTITATAEGVSQTASVMVVARPTFALTMSGAGAGSGTVAGDGINCVIAAGATSGRCTARYVIDQQITLTATPAQGSVFNGWTGSCAGMAACTLIMNQERQVTATFARAPVTLTVAGTGTGKRTVSGAGIACTIRAGTPSGACAAQVAQVAQGSTVTLTAIPDPGSGFFGMTGATCAGNSCTVAVNQNQTVTARFDALPAPVVSNLVYRGYLEPIVSPCGLTQGALVFAVDFTDPNGDTGVFVPIRLVYTFSNGGTGESAATGTVLSGDGFAGQISFTTCVLFGTAEFVDYGSQCGMHPGSAATPCPYAYNAPHLHGES